MATTETSRKTTQKLQRAIVDGLEDVKAQDIVVFDTEHLSALFERVIVASGTSNRQTKALASSVSDAVKDAGFPKPRLEGEGNGEWIIVDCGAAVVHIMQPTFRQYYHLEELWGGKPVRLKLGAEKPAGPTRSEAQHVAEKAAPSLRRSSAAAKGVAKAFPSRAQVKKDALAKVASDRKAATARSRGALAAGKPASPAAGAGARAAKSPPVVKTVVVKAATRPASRSAQAAEPGGTGKPSKKSAAKKVPARKTAPRSA